MCRAVGRVSLDLTGQCTCRGILGPAVSLDTGLCHWCTGTRIMLVVLQQLRALAYARDKSKMKGKTCPACCHAGINSPQEIVYILLQRKSVLILAYSEYLLRGSAVFNRLKTRIEFIKLFR